MTTNVETNPKRGVNFGTGKVEVSIQILTELLDVADQFADALGEQEPDSVLDVALKRLGVVTSSAVLPHVIDTLERNGGPGRVLPNLLEFALAGQLDQPADRPGAHPRDLKDRLYLRWLAHRPVELDEATEVEFHHRWTAQQGKLNSA
ncbi:hypothetical protein [Rhodococcus erythropolis]|uniref:hypothetical protein n=1 Tax=Rhodococcus erythropolis TaxID=1833 RepID=UPI00367215B5